MFEDNAGLEAKTVLGPGDEPISAAGIEAMLSAECSMTVRYVPVGGSARLRPVVQCRRRCFNERGPQIRTALTENLKELHVPAMRKCFEQAAHQAEKETLSYEQYLLQLTERECESRRQNRIAALLRESGLPREKTMPNFDVNRLPVKAGRQLKALADGSFLDRKENLLLFGNPGAGKSHLLGALAHELIAQGRRMNNVPCG